MTLSPLLIVALLAMTPSITYSGWNDPLSVETPRSWIWVPPPGAPEFVEMIAPGTLPCSAASIVCAGTLLSLVLETTVTEFAALTLDTVVAWPVMTCVSSCSTSLLSETTMLLSVPETGTTFAV